MPSRRAGSSIDSSATRSARSCGGGSAGASRPAGFSRWPSAWSSTVSARSGRSGRSSTGRSRPPSTDLTARRSAPSVIRVDGEKPAIADEATAIAHVEALRAGRPTVRRVSVKPSKRSPAPPFTTSTLQQEASRKLGFSPKRTMTCRPAVVRGPRDERRPGRPDHLHADRLGRPRRPGDGRGPRRDRGPLRPPLHDAQGTSVQDEDPQRPGGPRGDPADLVRARPRTSSRRSCPATKPACTA